MGTSTNLPIQRAGDLQVDDSIIVNHRGVVTVFSILSIDVEDGYAEIHLSGNEQVMLGCSEEVTVIPVEGLVDLRR